MRSVMSKDTVASCGRAGRVGAACPLRTRQHASASANLRALPADTADLVAAAGQVWKKREIEPKFETSSVPGSGSGSGSDLELRFAQLQKRLQVMEASLEDERKVNKELEADLQTAVKEGIKYRDHLALMLDIREKDARAQENIKSKHEQDEARQNATLVASLKEAEKSVEFERAEAQRHRTENSSLSAQVLPHAPGPALL